MSTAVVSAGRTVFTVGGLLALIAETVMARAAPLLSTGVGTGIAIAIGGVLLSVLLRLDGTLGRDVLIGTVFALAAMGSTAFYGVFFARVNRRHVGPIAPRILPVFAVFSIPLVLWAATAINGGECV